MTVLDWTLLRSIRSTLNVEHADESELQKIEDAADEFNKLQGADEVQDVHDLQTLVGVAQKVIKIKTMQAEAAIEELETVVKYSGMADENERLKKEIARLKSGDLQNDEVESQLKKLKNELDDVQIMLKREKQTSIKFEALYAEAERDRKSLQAEMLALQTELDEKIRVVEKQEVHATRQVNEKRVIAKLKEKNDQITKLMLALQEEESVNDDLKSTIDQLSAKLRDATIEINQSADLIEDLRKTNSALIRQVEQSGREIATLEGLVDEYMNKINELEALQPEDVDRSSRSSSGDRLDTWRKILEAKNAEIHDLQIRVVRLQQELDSVLSLTTTSTLNVLKKAISEKDQQIKSLVDNLGQATLDIEDNTRIIETLKGELVSEGQSHNDERKDRERLRIAEDMNADLEKQLLDREEQLAEALLVARKYEMGVYGLSDAVTEVRICKRKIASRDKNIAKLQDQLAESYVEIERLTRDNEQLCQGLIPPSKKATQVQQGQDNIEAEKTILALEDEILALKQSLRDLQRNLVDNVHKISSDWSQPWDKGTQISSHESLDERDLSRSQISQIPSKRQDSQDNDVEGNGLIGYNDVQGENQKLKEFLVQILEALQKLNNQRGAKQMTNSSSPLIANNKSAEDKQVAPPTPIKRKLPKEMPIEMKLLREFVSEVLDENQNLANDLDVIRMSTKANREEEKLVVKLFESAQQQVLRQRSLISVYSGVLAEQLAYADCLQEVYRRQLQALRQGTQDRSLKINLSYKVNFDYTAELKQQVYQLNNDIVALKKTLQDEQTIAAQAAIDDQTENMFMLEKLRMQIEALSKQHLKGQRLLAERESELIQVNEKLRKSQVTSYPTQIATTASEADAESSVTTGANSDDDTIQEESQTESERSVSHSFYRRMDSLREYNRKLCSELADAKDILKRTQDALKIKDIMLKEVNRQQAACGNLEQKMKVMEISLDTTKKLLGHKEQTLERYRQLVTDLKQELVSVKVKCNSDLQQLENTRMNELYQAKKQIAEITMKTFHHQQLALDNDAVPDQESFEKILAEKQVQIVQLQNKLKSFSTLEFGLKSELEQVKDSNQKLRENIMEAQERLRTFERLKQPVAPVPLEVVEMIVASDPLFGTVEHSAEQKGSELEKELSQLKEKLSTAENKIARLRSALDDAKGKTSTYEEEIERQNAKIEQLRKIQSLKRTDPKRIKVLEDDIENLRRQLYEAKQQRAEKSYDEIEKQAKQTVEVARWEEAKKWQMVIEGLKEQLKEKDVAIERLESAQTLLRAQIVRLEKEKYKLLDRIKASATVRSEHLQTIGALLKKIQQLEKAVVHHQKPLKKHRSKENQIVPILVNPLSPRRRRGKRKVSFDASVVDNEPSVSEPEEPDNSRLEDEPMPSNLDCM